MMDFKYKIHIKTNKFFIKNFNYKTCYKLNNIPQDYKDIKRFMPNFNKGLTSKQIEQRIKENLVNKIVDFTQKKISHIIIKNVFSLFNIWNFMIALLVLSVGSSYKNVFFLCAVISNTTIGIIQEIRSKIVLQRLSIVNMQTEMVVRNEKLIKIPCDQLVLDDVILLSSSGQITTDCIIKRGSVEVDESLLTGESDCITKTFGDVLLSGSFIMSGVCYAQIIHVGEKSYANQVTKEAKKFKKYDSEMIKSINSIVKFLSFVVVPLGIIFFLKQYLGLNMSLQNAVERTAALMISMIPQGLVLLTSMTLAVGAVTLSKKNVLVQQLYGIETLANTDIVCMDKTGTITQNETEVKVIEKCDEHTYSNRINIIIASMLNELNDFNNQTFRSLKNYVNKNKIIADKNLKAQKIVKFSSVRKWSGVNFKDVGSFVFGAPELILKENYKNYETIIQRHIKKGDRVVALAYSDRNLMCEALPGEIILLAIIVLSDMIRPNANKIINMLVKMGINIKILSGDNPITVSKIAEKIGIEDFAKYVDASLLKTKKELELATKDYNIFGRLSPAQKRDLINIYKQKRKVTMVGDGVNDVLALKDANCSIALAGGSSAAKHVSQLVLLNNDFDVVPSIINEGQRIINNIQRAGAMFLTKTIFSITLSIILLFFNQVYPFIPIQLTLISSFTVGIPSFVLSFERDTKKVNGRFLTNITKCAIPSSLTIVINIMCIYAISSIFKLSSIIVSTLSVITTAYVNILLLRKISLPINKLRMLVLIVAMTAFTTTAIIFKNFFALTYNLHVAIILAVAFIVDIYLIKLLNYIMEQSIKKLHL